jgi:hypothetical protein
MRTMPANPTNTPSSWAPLVRRPKSSAPNRAVNIGVAPLSSPVTAELMCCSAMGNSENGSPTQSTDTASMRHRSSRSIGARPPGSRWRIAAPRPTRSRVTTPGCRLSRPIAMNRKDAPQIVEMAAKTAQSIAVKAAPPAGTGGTSGIPVGTELTP